MSTTTQVNSATGIVGPTGSGKTSLFATLAEYVQDTYKQVLLLYSADGGGYPTKVQSLIRVGVIRVWRMRTRGEAFETTVQASNGWWPSRIDAITGETEPYVRLVPPLTEKYVMACPNGHQVRVVAQKALLVPTLCPECKVMVTRENMSVAASVARTRGFEQVGAVAYDGLTSFLSWQMDDMAGRHARQELKGEDSAMGGRIVSGDIVLGGNNRSHYGFVQGRAEAMVLNSAGIPGLSVPPHWSMLLLETVDEGGLPVKGPKLAGKAKTDEAPAWFGNMLEVGVVKDEQGHEVRRLSLNEFIDDSNVRHLVKHRGSPSMPSYLQDVHGGPWSQVNLGVFFQLLAKDVEDNAQAAVKRFGVIGEGVTNYGDDAALPTVNPAQNAPASPAPVAAGGQPTVRAPKPRVKPVTSPAPADTVEVAQAQAQPTAAPKDEPIPSGPTEPSPPSPATSEPVGSAPPSGQPAAPQVARPSIARPAGIAPPPGPRPPASAPRTPPRPKAITPPAPVSSS